MTDTMILTTLGGIWGLFQNENEAIVDGNLSSIQALAVILAAMLAAFSLIRTSVDYVHGDGRFGWQLMRPITILLLVMNFYPQWLREVSLPNMCAHLGRVRRSLKKHRKA